MFLSFKKFKNWLNEGIDIDEKNKMVRLNFNHDKGVNTSIKGNPVKYEVNNIDIVSIFSRLSNKDYMNGNPLIYALKGIKGQKISDYDRKMLLERIKDVAKKLNDNYDTLVVIPSSNKLNSIFRQTLNSVLRIPNENIISQTFTKLSPKEIQENHLDLEGLKAKEINDLKVSFGKMVDGFSFKLIEPKYREHIKNIYTDEFSDEIEQAELINGKNILILDDTISSGSTISIFVDKINKMYVPNKITVITLFSKVLEPEKVRGY